MRTQTIDLTGIRSKAALHQRLKEQLSFPAWYGPSWDALFDRLVAQPGLPDEVQLTNWQQLAPADVAMLRRIALDYAAERPGRRLMLVA